MSNPTWAYRRAADGGVEARIFDDGLPDGWADSPARVDDAQEPEKPKRGRPRKKG